MLIIYLLINPEYKVILNINKNIINIKRFSSLSAFNNTKQHLDELVIERATSEISFFASQSACFQRRVQPFLHIVAVKFMLRGLLKETEIHNASSFVSTICAILRRII